MRTDRLNFHSAKVGDYIALGRNVAESHERGKSEVKKIPCTDPVKTCEYNIAPVQQNL